MSFSKLGLSPSLYVPLAAMRYTEPTPVQAASIPIVLNGSDLLARAQTGTGKTAAFALPMIERLVVRRNRPATRHPLGLVLVPTRELALQVQRALTIYGAPVRVRVTAIFGGVPMPGQVQALRRGTDIVVATPGRLIDHLQRRTIDLSAVQMVTLDEADRMLDMGFLPSLRRVLQALPASRQTLLFSATLSGTVAELARQFTREPLRVDVSPAEPVAPTITHCIHAVDHDRKRALLQHVLTQGPAGQALVFCKTKRGADRVGEHLNDAGIKAAIIHGNKGQGARGRSLADFKAGRVSALVATDIAARGLDIAQLPLVVNYDLPLVAEDYIHRVGRTGRAGLAGRAISLVTASDRQLLHEIQQLLSAPLEYVAVAGFETTTSGASPAGERHLPRNRPQRSANGSRGGGMRTASRNRPPAAGSPFRRSRGSRPAYSG
ncbi:MAG: DEAD/DEAH box helicase [Vicinamibacterales bacterium]